jgi:hypothetical protein
LKLRVDVPPQRYSTTLYISTRKLIPQFLFKKRPKAFCDILSIRNIPYTRKLCSFVPPTMHLAVPAARKGVDTSNSVRSVETMPLKTLADVMILRQSCHTMQSQDTPRENAE